MEVIKTLLEELSPLQPSMVNTYIVYRIDDSKEIKELITILDNTQKPNEHFSTQKTFTFTFIYGEQEFECRIDGTATVTIDAMIDDKYANLRKNIRTTKKTPTILGSLKRIADKIISELAERDARTSNHEKNAKELMKHLRSHRRLARLSQPCTKTHGWRDSMKPLTEKPKLCVECHFHYYYTKKDTNMCRIDAEERINTVTGETWWTKEKQCRIHREKQQRKDIDKCGPEGKYWKKPIPNKPSRPTTST